MASHVVFHSATTGIRVRITVSPVTSPRSLSVGSQSRVSPGCQVLCGQDEGGAQGGDDGEERHSRCSELLGRPIDHSCPS
jgi:hypothetical protein